MCHESIQIQIQILTQKSKYEQMEMIMVHKKLLDLGTAAVMAGATVAFAPQKAPPSGRVKIATFNHRPVISVSIHSISILT
jgi:hypothetical protein